MDMTRDRVYYDGVETEDCTALSPHSDALLA